MNDKDLHEEKSCKGWKDEEKYSYDAKVLEKEYEERLYSVEGRKLLNRPNESDLSKGQKSSDNK